VGIYAGEQGEASELWRPGWYAPVVLVLSDWFTRRQTSGNHAQIIRAYRERQYFYARMQYRMNTRVR